MEERLFLKLEAIAGSKPGLSSLSSPSLLAKGADHFTSERFLAKRIVSIDLDFGQMSRQGKSLEMPCPRRHVSLHQY